MRLSVPMTWAAAVAVAVAAAVAAVGCDRGGDGLPRESVSGKVTLDGRPLDRGEITFVPTGGDGPPVGGEIQDGTYAIRRADGPVPGPHRVAIFSAKPTGKKIPDEADPSILYDERAETIPDRYNARSDLAAEVKAGGGNTFDFELTGRKDPAKVKAKR
jgi:hypothetical protein